GVRIHHIGRGIRGEERLHLALEGDFLSGEVEVHGGDDTSRGPRALGPRAARGPSPPPAPPWGRGPPRGRPPTLSRAEKFVYFDRHGRLRCTGWGRGQVGTGPSDRGEGPEALLRDPIGVQPGGRSADAGTHGSTRRSATNESRERNAGQDPRG